MRLIVVACLVALGSGFLTAFLSGPAPPRRAFRSVVDPADHPMSPHAWPEGVPIIIECWGGAADRDRARTLSLATSAGRKALGEVLADDSQDAWTGRSAELTEPSRLLDTWTVEGVPHPLAMITLGTPAGSRYRWSSRAWVEDDPLFPPVRERFPATVGDVHQMFPMVDPTGLNLDDAQSSAVAHMMDELRQAVTDDAVATCAHELLAP